MDGSLKERLQEINTINAIMNMAEEAIYKKTGTKMRLIIMPFVIDKRRLAPREMVHLIGCALGITPEEIESKARHPRLVDFRHICWYLLGEYYPDMSLKERGAIWGADHTTVIFAEKKLQGLLDVRDEAMTNKYQAAVAAISQWEAANGN